MSTQSRRWLCLLLIFAGISLLALAARSYFAPPPGPRLRVPQTFFKFATAP